LLDDGKERFGFKMKDAELIGFPYTIIIGKELENGMVQVYTRRDKSTAQVGQNDVLGAIMELVK
jgi:prolyl-tRNA synthetase